MLILLYIGLAVLLIGLIIAGTAYSRVRKIIEKYSNQDIAVGISCLDFVNKCNQSFDLNLKLALTEKELQDCYIPKKKILVLSKKNANSSSISAISVAGHEIGHAIQEKNGNFLLKLDNFFRKMYRILKIFIIPLIICGIVFMFFDKYFYAGVTCLLVVIGIWILSVITRCVTIPMEYEASKIAYNILKDNHILTRSELKITKKILNAAALTYVGALFINILNILRSIKYSFRR